MTQLLVAAREVQGFLQEQGWRFCFIGGLVVERWGQPRATQDVDLTLLTGFGEEERYIEAILSRFASRRPDGARFALAARVLMVEAANKVGIDVALAGLPFEEEVIARATPFEFAPGFTLITCSAEDLLVLKAFAERAHDWGDVQGIIARQWGKLDWDLIRRTLEPLCELKDSPDILDEVERLRKKIGAALAKR